MGRFDKIAIFTDLDGTFLGKNSKPVERNIEALRYFLAEGGLFSLSTGRMHFGMESLVGEALPLINCPAILCNGTYLYDFQNGRAVYETFMDSKMSLALVRMVEDLGLPVNIRASFVDGYLLDPGFEDGYRRLIAAGIEDVYRVPTAEWTGEGWYKLVVCGEKPCLDIVRAAVKKNFDGVFEISSSSNSLLEFQMKGINKASGLSMAKAYLGDRDRTIYVCGDFDNDYEILKVADVAVCPSNASDRIKSICDHCFCSNKEGLIADLIEYIEKNAL